MMKTNYTELKEIIKEEAETEVYLHMLQERVVYLKSQGMNKQQVRRSIVNEGVVDMLKGGAASMWDMAPEAIKQTIIEKALEYVERKMGLNPKGWLVAVINKAIANMKSEDWKAVIGGDCDTIAAVLTEALEEELLDRLIIKLSEDLYSLISKRVGISADSLDRFVGEAARVTIRNQLFELIKEQDLIVNITDSVADFVCEQLPDMIEGAIG
tara:strand:- start:221 stop:856 length:636 start_codon:yes stop_codon:yes gene_type:complete